MARPKGSLGRPLLERFMDNVSPEPNSGCWLWVGKLNTGNSKYPESCRPKFYGRSITKSRLAARINWVFSHGEVPKGLEVCHKCDVYICVNPDHMYLGTRARNMRDAVERRRHWWFKDRLAAEANMTAAREKSYFSICGEESPWAKLTWEKVEAIRASDKTNRELGEIYGVSHLTVYDVRHFRTWRKKPDHENNVVQHLVR